MAPIRAVMCSGLVFVAGAVRAQDHFLNDCQNYLTGETSSSQERLAKLCDRHGFSSESCDAALATMSGKLTKRGIKPLCSALESSEGADKVIARLQHRRGRKALGDSREAQMVALDKAVASKKGQPDYLVASDDPPVFEEPPSPLAHPPPSPVDMTIAQPPDANGNPYDEPQWGVNGAPGAVPAPAAPRAAPAETAAEEEESAPEAEAEAAEEAPPAEEAAEEEASEEAPAEAEAEAVEEEASEEAPAEAEEEAEPEAQEEEAAEPEAAETEAEEEAETETEEAEQ